MHCSQGNATSDRLGTFMHRIQPACELSHDRHSLSSIISGYHNGPGDATATIVPIKPPPTRPCRCQIMDTGLSPRYPNFPTHGPG
jgi:hypothetical protein